MNSKKFNLKSLVPYLVAAAVFVVLTLVYCSPILSGKVISAGDTKSWEGMYQESKSYSEKSGESVWWTGSMFCGMPTFQIGGGSFAGVDLVKPLSKVSRLGFTGTLAIIMGYFIGFFILMRAFGVSRWLAIVGSIATTFSSYFFIIIAAGHVTKAVALGLLAPILAGFYLIYRKKYLLGGLLTMIYSCLTVLIHPQMTYYFCLVMGVCFLAEIYIHAKEKAWKELGIATAIFLGAFLVGIGTNYGKYCSNKDYVTETMRGGHSELVKAEDATNKTGGLDLDYATAWSYGIGESATFLVPGFMGNASGYNVGDDSEVFKTLVKKGVPRKNAHDFCTQVPTYWGTQPFTAGPVYMGAIVCFLFVLGLLLVKGPYKWALLAATVMSILLSWGRNFMPLTNLFFDYFPMYNKFRAVSSILVVAEVTMPLLGFMALESILKKEYSKEELLKKIYIAGGVTGGICLILALLGPSLFDFSSPNDAASFAKLPDWLPAAILDERAHILRVDAFRSFFFIAAAFLLVWLYVQEKLKSGLFVAILGLGVLVDMWPIDKRFMNDSCFVSEKQDKNYFKKLPWEADLLETEKDPNYRVLNLSTNTFNESRTSYYFKSIGGYHAAKLRRYQDMIEEHISPEMSSVFTAIQQTGGRLERCPGDSLFPILNMLNAKYFVVPLQSGEAVSVPNPHAMGNGWFVDSLVVVNTPNEECDALSTMDLHRMAVTDAKFGDFAKSVVAANHHSSQVNLLSYAPNHLEYETVSENAGTIVFSEIYYPFGWKATIDGEPADHFRANYTLRALNVPAGNHKIAFDFLPETTTGIYAVVSYLCYAIIYGLLLFGAFQLFRRFKTEKSED